MMNMLAVNNFTESSCDSSRNTSNESPSPKTEENNKNLLSKLYAEPNIDEVIIPYISSYLLNIISYNQKTNNIKRANKHDILFTKKNPKLTLEEFLIRIVKYSRMEVSTLASAFLYMRRMLCSDGFILCQYNVYRFILGCCLLSIVFNEDVKFNKAYYAKIGALQVEDLNTIEYSLFQRLDFRLFISESDFFYIYSEIKAYSYFP